MRTGNRKGKPRKDSNATLVVPASMEPKDSIFETLVCTDQVKGALELYDRMEAYYNHLEQVGFYPHTGQQPILKRLFSPKFQTMKAFCQCSRNFGKTTLAAIFAVGMSIFKARQKGYIIGPFLTQTIEIYHAGGDLDQMIPAQFYATPGDSGSYFNKSEMRWAFDTQSFIKLDGADNEARVRGYKPHWVVGDEFQDWKKEVWGAMEPNLVPNKAPALLIGTPPDRENVYTEQAATIKREMEAGDKSYFYVKRTIYDNPRWSIEEIERRKRELLERGEDSVWLREYMAEFIPGGAASIYPQFNHETHCVPRDEVVREVEAEKRFLIPYVVYDPSSTRFAASGFLYHPYLGKAYWMFAVLEQDAAKIAMRVLLPRVLEAEREHLLPYAEQAPYRYFDEAAALWAIDAGAYGLDLLPTNKRHNDKSNVITLVRDMFLTNSLVICKDLDDVKDELYNYHYGENGKIVKKRDDLIDTMHYFVAESGYEIKAKDKPEAEALPRSRVPSYNLNPQVQNSVSFAMFEGVDIFGFDDIGDLL